MITENVSTLRIHKLSQEQYDRENDAGTLEENAIYITPDEAVPIAVVTGGTGAAYTATVPNIKSLDVGVSFVMIPHTTSTTATPTLNVNGLGAKQFRRRISEQPYGVTQFTKTTWAHSDEPIRVIYDGMYWIVEGHSKPVASDLHGTLSISGGGTGAKTAADALTNLGVKTYGSVSVSSGALTKCPATTTSDNICFIAGDHISLSGNSHESGVGVTISALVDDAASLDEIIADGLDIENSTNPASTRLVSILAELMAESVCKSPDFLNISPEGYGNSGLVEGSGAIGSYNTVAAPQSFTVGISNQINAKNSIAVGGYNTINDTGRSVAIGYENTADGQDSLAVGHRNAAHAFQTVVGMVADTSTTAKGACNLFSTNGSVFVVGNGQGTVSGSNVTYTKSNAFRVSSAGQCYGVNAFVSSGADFAEYFEWADGNPNAEDRRGRFVTLDGEKIRFANADDDYILGVVSTIGAFIGNSYSEEWQGRYLKDVFGEWLTEEVDIPETTIEREVEILINESTGETKTEMIMEVIPAYKGIRYVVNPDYNPEQEYVSREFRKEWSPVGFHGQVVVIDDGTCQVNGYCKPSVDGTATTSETGYRVMARIDDTHIKVLVK